MSDAHMQSTLALTLTICKLRAFLTIAGYAREGVHDLVAHTRLASNARLVTELRVTWPAPLAGTLPAASLAAALTRLDVDVTVACHVAKRLRTAYVRRAY